MNKVWKALSGAAVAAALVAAPIIGAPAMAAGEPVVVCKYVTTPGEDEVLRVVIEPDESSLGDGFTGTFPYEFADAQIKSIAIGWADQGLDITDCPGYQPEQPDDEPLSETRNDSYCTQPLDGTRTAVVEQRTGTRTYVWDGDSWNPQDSWGEWMLVSSEVTADPTCALPVVAVPTLFDAGTAPPTCEDDGTLPTLAAFANVTLTWDRPYDGPGIYTLTATAATGYVFPDGTTVKTKTFTVLGAIGYQSEDPEAACYLDEEPPPPVEVVLATPGIHDVCGTEDDSAALPAATTGVSYHWLDDEDANELDVVAHTADGYVVTSMPTGWVETADGVFVYAQADLTDVPCPAPAAAPPASPPAAVTSTTALPATGGGVPLLLPLAAGMTLLLGIGAAAYGATRRRA